MITWDKFYSKEQTLRDFLGIIFTHTELFAQIIEEKPREILEIGVGTGTTSIFLSHLGFEITTVDNNEKVINSARNFCERLNGKVNYVLADALDLEKIFRARKFDVVFSQGFFEHLDNKQIRQQLEEQLKVGRIVFISVPSKFYMKKDFGNERLLSRKKWLDILSGFDIEFARYYGFNLPLRKSLLNFIFNPLLIIKFILGSVLKERSHLLIKIRP